MGYLTHGWHTEAKATLGGGLPGEGGWISLWFRSSAGMQDTWVLFPVLRDMGGKMAESSLYTQRLEAIVGRRKVQERILRTRRELEEEKLRAQQLKRKSLRDQWLMEGSCLPPENNPTSPLWQTQSRIQELEQDLSSLQSQMQQLDNPERHGRPHKALEDAKQPAGGSCEARGAGSASAGGGGCGCETEPALRLAPVPPKRAMRPAARETLENGDVSRAGPFGVEGVGPGEGKTDTSSAAPGTQDDGAGASAKQPEKLGVGKVEMIIRNHLGQEVGSMDAIGRTSPETEGEAPRGENGLEETWDGRTERESQSPPALVSDALDSGMEESVAGEGSREGPEGESGALDGEAQALPDENCCLDSPRPEPDGELEEPSGIVEEREISAEPARGATGMEETEAAQRAQRRAAEPERPEELGPTQGRGPMWQGPAREPERQVSPGAERPQAAGMGEGAETKAYSQDQIPSPQEAKGALQDQIPALQDQIPSPQEAKGALQDQIPALQDQIPSPQEAKGALQDQIPALQDQIPSPQEAKGAPQDQIPSVVQDQTPSSLQEAEVSMQNQIPTVQDQIPLSLLEVKTSLQGQILSPQEAKAALQDQIPSSLQEANASLQNQIPSPQEATVALQDQIPSSLQEANASLQDQIPSPHEAKHSFHSQIPSSQEPIPALHGELPLTPRELPSGGAPGLEQVPSRPRESMALKGGSGTGPVPSTAEETTENLGKLHPEQQPLLKEASGLRTGQKAPLDPVARSLQPGAGTLKSLAAVSPEAPTYTTASANTASPCQGRSATTPRPGDGQETGRRKQKTCQCCSVM
ncbi:paralemmin-3 isoform X2 [Trachemys scripta elegans]|uniref:paralemmin-3 isoform X2 n=1 Tax=Trachemys scripta elegans TaxID=31138 RepID=UPI001556A65F|nr:paralemmin-3 isoform X2 [Trachemys scripta elegans]